MLQALIFDSFYDKHRGVVAYIRLFNGQLKAGDTIYFLATKSKIECQEVGFFKPDMTPTQLLQNGEVGYIVTGLKTIGNVKVGDTVCDAYDQSLALSGYKEIEPKVFASIFTVGQEDYPKLRDSMGKLKLNDASLFFEPVNVPALGFGYRCGFLGLLHMDIVRERLEREFGLDLIITTPSVEYRVALKGGNQVENGSSKVKTDEQIIDEKFQIIKDKILEDLTNQDIEKLLEDY